MLDLNQMRDDVIKPALEMVDLYSPEAADLILFTGVQESRYKYVRQLGQGPARSFWQIEPKTMYGHYQNWINFRPELGELIRKIEPVPNENALTWNMGFAVVMARLKYRRSKLPLPQLGDGGGMAHIWKEVYNTCLGKGTTEEFVDLWNEHKYKLM